MKYYIEENFGDWNLYFKGWEGNEALWCTQKQNRVIYDSYEDAQKDIAKILSYKITEGVINIRHHDQGIVNKSQFSVYEVMGQLYTIGEPDKVNHIPSEQYEFAKELVSCLDKNKPNKIQAIKFIRNHFNLGLKESKILIDIAISERVY